MDRRQQKSKAAIFDAFVQLLSQKNYNQITVQEIIDAANVGRTTFYAHFETKDALLRALCTNLFAHVFSDRNDTASAHNFSLTDGAFQTIVAHMLLHLQDSGQTIHRLLCGESSELFLVYFKEYLDRNILHALLKDVDSSTLAVPESFLRNHISSSFVNMVQWWVRSGMRESPEELSAYFVAVIEPIFK